MDERGNISLPSDIGATAMTEREICELFGVIAPTVRAGIKALCKSGVLSVYDIKRIIRLSDRYSAEVYNLETIAALAFRIESFGAAKVRKVLLERIINGRKEKTTVFVSVVSDGKPYFAIGFPNVAGGFEVRNRFFKGFFARGGRRKAPCLLRLCKRE